MVRRYAHFAANHLTEYARQIDSILQKMSQICPTKEYQRLEKVDYCLILNPYRIRIQTLNLLLLQNFSLFEKRGGPQLGPQAYFAENISYFRA